MRRRAGTALGQPYVSTEVGTLCNRRNYAACSTRRLMRRRYTPGSIHRPKPIQKPHFYRRLSMPDVACQGCLAAPMTASRGWGSPSACHRWLPTWLPAIRPPRVRRRPACPLTARHHEVTPGAGPLRAIPVRPQVAFPALRALLAPGTPSQTHQHTVTTDRAGITMPRPPSAPVSR
jgi:hypothetical protein